MAKPLTRLYPPDIERIPWSTHAGRPAERHLAVDPTGASETSLITAEPGAVLDAYTAEFWEETWVLRGSYVADGLFVPAGSYLCRSPGTEMGEAYTAEGYSAIRFRDRPGPGLDKRTTTLFPIDIDRMAWAPPPGSVAGIEEKILNSGPSGSATRILRCAPGVDTGVFNHDHDEEVLITAGSYKMGDELHPAGTYTCKGPGVDHGPFITSEGYRCLEIRNYR